MSIINKWFEPNIVRTPNPSYMLGWWSIKRQVRWFVLLYVLVWGFYKGFGIDTVTLPFLDGGVVGNGLFFEKYFSHLPMMSFYLMLMVVAVIVSYAVAHLAIGLFTSTSKAYDIMQIKHSPRLVTMDDEAINEYIMSGNEVLTHYPRPTDEVLKSYGVPIRGR